MKTKLINAFLILAVLVGLAGCGGGGGGGGTPQIDKQNIAISVTTEMQGVYSGVIGSDDFVSLVVPTADPATVNWYGLTFVSSHTVVIYSGQLSLGTDGLASPIGLKAFSGIAPISMSGSITAASPNSYIGSLNIPPSVNNVVFTAVAKTPPVFNASQTASSEDTDGVWEGDWIDGSNFSGAVRLRFSSTTTFLQQKLSTPRVFLGCILNITSSATSASKGNFFMVSLKFDQAPLETCARVGQTLSGVAVVYHPTTSTRRLELIALDSEGRGISFRADR